MAKGDAGETRPTRSSNDPVTTPPPSLDTIPLGNAENPLPDSYLDVATHDQSQAISSPSMSPTEGKKNLLLRNS
jgi:hypothetical protein